jgi:hypothetical protein
MPLDIGVGLLLGIVMHGVSGLNYYDCLLLGTVACLLPDLDFVWPVLRGKYSYKKVHRDGLHYPLIFIPGVGLAGALLNPYVGLTFALGAFIHFAHDSQGIGWGVKWLFPFRNISYAFLYRAKLSADKGMPQKPYYHWTDEERAASMAKYADPHWITQIYFRPNLYGAIEYTVLAIGIIASLIYRQ